MSDKLIKISNRADIVSLGAHLFCCGIPAFVAILSLVSTISLSGSSLLMHIEHYSEKIHLGAFIVSTIMVIIALGSFLLSRAKDCTAAGHCTHEPCAPKKKKNWKLMAISLGLYTLNILAFFFLDHLMPYGHGHAH